MSDVTTQSLSRAYELIEAGRRDEARAILEPVLATDEDNADAWWLYAHAVEDIETARRALNRVLQVNPRYPGATQLMERLEQQARSAEPDLDLDDLFAEEQEEDREVVPIELDLDLDEFEDDDEDFAFAEPPTRRRPSPRTILLGLLLFVVLITVVVLAVIVGTQPPDDPTPTTAAQITLTETVTPTQVIVVPPPTEVEDTEIEDVEIETPVIPTPTTTTAPLPEPTEDIIDEPTPTNIPAQIQPTPQVTPEVDEIILPDVPTQVIFDVTQILADFELFSDQPTFVQSELGSTVVMSVCGASGDALRNTLNATMLAIVEQNHLLPADADAVGVHVVNCVGGTTIRVIAVSVADIAAFEDGILTEEAFRGQWRAIGLD